MLDQHRKVLINSLTVAVNTHSGTCGGGNTTHSGVLNDEWYMEVTSDYYQ